VQASGPRKPGDSETTGLLQLQQGVWMCDSRGTYRTARSDAEPITARDRRLRAGTAPAPDVRAHVLVEIGHTGTGTVWMYKGVKVPF